jgi:hypothetical protein
MTDPTPAAPKVIGAPDMIYLVYGELEEDDTHAICRRAGRCAAPSTQRNLTCPPRTTARR